MVSHFTISDNTDGIRSLMYEGMAESILQIRQHDTK